jgi:hypothetical protein
MQRITAFHATGEPWQIKAAADALDPGETLTAIQGVRAALPDPGAPMRKRWCRGL